MLYKYIQNVPKSFDDFDVNIKSYKSKKILDSYIKKVRKFLMDYEENNKLLENEKGESRKEFSDEDILNAIEMVYYDSVQSPPVRLRISLSNMIEKLWFLYGVIAFLLNSAVFLYSRNRLPFQDGGVSIDEEGMKVATYKELADGLYQKYLMGLKEEKIRYNIETFYGNGGYGTSFPGVNYFY